MSSAARSAAAYSGRFAYGAGGAHTLRFTSPHAPSVEPMARMTDEKTVFRSP